jgi:hypothetical protein
MALLWFDGFTTSYHPDVIARRYTGSESVTGTNNNTNDAYVTGGKSPLSTTLASMHTPDLLGTAATTIICGADLKASSDTMSSYSPTGFAFRNADGEQLRVHLEEVSGWPVSGLPGGYSLQQMVVTRGATVLATSTTRFAMDSANTPCHVRFEIKVVFGAAGSVEVKYGRPNKPSAGFQTVEWDTSLASVDTEDQSSAGCTSVEYFHHRMGIDNWVIMDDSGADMNDFMGFLYSHRVANSLVGTYAEWGYAGGATTVQGALYEAAVNDDDDQRVSSNSPGQKSSANIQDTATSFNVGTNSEIKAIVFGQLSKMDTAGTATGVGFVRISSTDYDLDEQFTPAGTSYEYALFIQENSPATASAWTVTEIEGMELGVRHVS